MFILFFFFEIQKIKEYWPFPTLHLFVLPSIQLNRSYNEWIDSSVFFFYNWKCLVVNYSFLLFICSFVPCLVHSFVSRQTFSFIDLLFSHFSWFYVMLLLTDGHIAKTVFYFCFWPSAYEHWVPNFVYLIWFIFFFFCLRCILFIRSRWLFRPLISTGMRESRNLLVGGKILFK